MNRIQEELDKIAKQWGKIQNAQIESGFVRRIKVFKNGVFIGDCLTRKQVEEMTGAPFHSISAVLYKKKDTTNGFYLVHSDEWNGETMPQRYLTKGLPKPIAVYKDGNLIGEYSSQSKACKELNLNPDIVCKILKSGKEEKTHKGYTFSYV